MENNKKIMVVGYGAIGGELLKSLFDLGYNNISVLTSKKDIANNIKCYDLENPIFAIEDFKPELIIDASDTEYTQKLLGFIVNSDVGNFTYFAITPDVKSNVSTQKSLIEPYQKVFDEKKIKVIRTDATNSLVSDMLTSLKLEISKSDYNKITIFDAHRREKELFTQGVISMLSNNLVWEEVISMSIKVDGSKNKKHKFEKSCSSQDFKSIIQDIRNQHLQSVGNQERFKNVSIKIKLLGRDMLNCEKRRIIKIKSSREICDKNFELKTQHRSINVVKVDRKIKFTACISKKDIASGIIKQIERTK